MDFAAGVVGLWSRNMSDLPAPFNAIVSGVETAALLATTVDNTQSIAAQRYNKASSVSSGSSSSSTSASIALTPTKSALTSKDENLNMINKSGTDKEKVTVVKVSDINNVQNTVKVRDNNSSY